ncbi:unnamed protein product [Cuscuta europaea]|uniref:Uncharacterized protein n=1 Tax=Cuscuta europaea TaxID=41803 RepID=A0A9P0YFB7_CUSEU|nr:unnamed protein product [Cuscuta europaea]
MVNSQLSNGVTGRGTGKTLLDKQLAGATKKTALKDLQNQNGRQLTNLGDSSLLLGTKLGADGTRVCGSKRLTPESPSSPVCHMSLASNGASEHIINARRRFELELGRGRAQNDLDKYVDLIPPKRNDVHQMPNQSKENNISDASITMPYNNITYSQSGAQVFLSVGKSNTAPLFVRADSANKFISDNSQSVEFKVADDQHRTERFARLHKLLKKCDGSSYCDYTQMLLRLSPSELSRHAVDLEKRAIQLVIDEGKEINRGKMLNILRKSPPDSTPLQTAQLLQPKHE